MANPLLQKYRVMEKIRDRQPRRERKPQAPGRNILNNKSKTFQKKRTKPLMLWDVMLAVST